MLLHLGRANARRAPDSPPRSAARHSAAALLRDNSILVGPVYLDCAATTPVDPRIRDVLLHHLEAGFGNAGSRTHDYGRRARAAVEQGRHQVAVVVNASRGEAIFTSGATESNNLTILGLESYGRATGK